MMAKSLVISDTTKCAGCMLCILRCSLKVEGAFRLAASRIKVNRLVDQDDEFEIVFTDECDACGLCVRYCPFGALIQNQG